MQPGIDIREEAWGPAADEFSALGLQHFTETDDGVEPRRPFKLDCAIMQQIYDAGMLSITAARSDGKLVGYCMWMIMPDVESAGLLIAQHGPWFSLPGFPGVGVEMLKRSIETIKKRGVQMCFPHHRMQGRGAKLGNLYRRLGAVETQHTYSLWIGS